MRRHCPETFFDPSPTHGGAALLLRRIARRALAAGVERLLLWHELARQRRQLEIMDDRMLKDIGLTRADVDIEAQKPFWRL